jgi:uncharacterized protein
MEWHAGERAVQERLGGTELADRLLGGIRAELPDAGVRFVRRQPWLLLAGHRPDGKLWTSVVSGLPGFLDADPPGVLTVAASPGPDDPLVAAIAEGAPVGTIALDPAHRRRLRVNGRLRAQAGGFAVEIHQALSNCPQHIRRRALDPAWQPRAAEAVSDSAALTAAQEAWLATADTAFIATAGADGSADLSHRGGDPGFLTVAGGRISWDELPGNNMYLTLGNLEQVGRAALLVIDFATGATLYLTGDCEVSYDTGNDPRITVIPRRVVERRHGAPAPWHDEAP